MECISKKYTQIVGTMFNICDSINAVISVIIMYYIQNLWTFVAFIIVRIIVLVVLVFIFVPESPEWLHITGQTNKCNEALYYLSKCCGKDDIPLIENNINLTINSKDDFENNQNQS